MINRRNVPLIAGLIMLPAFVFQDRLLPLAVQVLFLIVLQIIIGRKVRILPIIIMLITVPGLNLFQSHGRVLAEIFGFPVTQGALVIGLRRALILIGLIYLSRFMVSRKPRFPGRIGSLLSLQFAFYEGFLSRKPDMRPRHVIEHLDKLLIDLESRSEELQQSENPDAQQQFAPGYIPYGITVLLFWGISLLSYLT